MNSMNPGKDRDFAGFDGDPSGPSGSESSLRSFEFLLQELSSGASGMMRLAAEARVQLESALPELERLRVEKAMLLVENQELQRRRQELAAETESERAVALADLQEIRNSAEAEIEQLRQAKAGLEAEIQGLEDRRSIVARQIETFLKDQLSVLRQVDIEARALAKDYQTRPSSGEEFRP